MIKMGKLEVAYGFVKPHAYNHRNEIEEMILDAGLQIVHKKDPYYFSRKLAENHYEMHRDKPWYKKIVRLLSEGPTDQLVMLGTNAIKKLSDVTGPTDPKKAPPNTIRGRFGTTLPYNAFHRADSKSNVLREIFLNFSEEELSNDVLKILERYKKNSFKTLETLETELNHLAIKV
jgi:nucleoside-diphosphate kinase